MRRFSVLLFVFTLLMGLTISPAKAAVSCSLGSISGQSALIQCRDDAGNNLSVGQVDLPQIIKTVRVLVPGPTVTAKPFVRPPRTIFVPGPTETVTAAPSTVYVTPSPKVFISRIPGAVQTVTLTPSTVIATATATVTASPTVEHRVDNQTTPQVLFDPPPITAKKAVGYSVLALLVLCGLIILGLWLGYLLGWKDKAREEKKFLSALRDQFYYKGEHS